MKSYFQFINTFLKENKVFFLLAFLYVLICILVFLFYPLPEDIKSQLIKQTYQVVQNIAHLWNTHLKLAFFIFLNNAFIWLIIFLTGFLLSFWGLFIVFANVFITWLIITVGIEKMWLLKSLLAILPHWIFEITAILLSLGLSFKLTYLVVKKIWNWKNVKFWIEFKKMIYFWFGFILPLLLFAAFIESFVTPLLVGKSI